MDDIAFRHQALQSTDQGGRMPTSDNALSLLNGRTFLFLIHALAVHM